LLPCLRAGTVATVPYIAVPEGIPGIRSLFAFRPEVGRALSLLADTLLHAPNTLTPGERELIAAYVSSLNACVFCHRSHAAIASCHLGDEGATADAVARDPEHAPVSDKMKALLAIAAQVQQGGQFVQETHIARARREGATDNEIHDAVLIAAAFCMFNRYVDGLRAWTPDDLEGYRMRARVVAEHGYAAPAPPVSTT
jgi:uncharacterized peroxidase-related enzyme